jgi:hypothetical protein
LQSNRAGRCFYISQHDVGICIGRIDEHCDAGGLQYHLAQEFQPLCQQLGTEKIDACRVAARPSEAGDKTRLTGSSGKLKTMGIVVVAAFAANGVAAPPLRRSRRPATNQVGGQHRQAIELISQPIGIQSPRSHPRRSRYPSGPGGIRADGPLGCPPMQRGGIRITELPAAARAPRAATPPRRKKA